MEVEKEIPKAIHKRYESRIKEFLVLLNLEKNNVFNLKNELSFFKKITFILFFLTIFLLLFISFSSSITPTMFDYDFYVAPSNTSQNIHTEHTL